MGDSEDEYDRKHRDKFRGERTESYQRGGSDRRDFQRSSGMSARSDFRAGGFSRAQDMAPPNKRGRYDWGDDRRGMGGYGHDGASYKNSYSPAWQQHYPSYSQSHSHSNASRNSSSDGVETQPAMMSFKSFLQTQDDNITDKDALKSYAEYKLEFKRQQLHEFFVVHKEEEWFKIKYHPEESVKNKEELAAAIQKRVEVFQEFMAAGRFEKLSMDMEKSEELMKLLDSVVIRLEGGSELDLLALEEADLKEETVVKQEPVTPRVEPAAPSVELTVPVEKETPAEEKKTESEPDVPPTEEAAAEKAEPELPATSEPEPPATSEPEPPATSEPEVATEVKEEAELAEKKEKEKEKEDDGSSDDSDSEAATPAGDSGGADAADVVEPPPPGLEEPIGAENGEPAEKDSEPMEQETDAVSDSGEDDMSDDKTEDTKESKDGEKDGDDKSGRSSPEDMPPRCYHRVTSIVLRNLAPTVTKQEVVAICKRFPEFLRVAMSDPQPERRWFRRGWVTFMRHANINDICWNLNNVRLRKCELGAVVNRDLMQRIRPANSVASLAEVVRNDIKLAALVVQRLDGRAGLWGAPTEDGEDNRDEDRSLNFALTSKNPLLKNITEHLIETASAEEDELLGTSEDASDRASDDPPCDAVDEGVLRALDRLLIYLRVVHSLDFYNHCQYVNEDAMPNRCGIVHLRAPPPATKVFPQEVSDYRLSFEQKIGQFLQPFPKISDEEYRSLGPKEPDVEVEKFVKANTQELSENKWLCPLSGKKFKGPDFIRKHIFNKFGEKLEEVRQEVAYYNNYLRDARRPQLPEHPANRSVNRRSGPPDREGYGSSGQPPYQHGGYGGYGHRQGYPGPSGQGPRSNRGGNRGWAPYGNSNGGNRRIISYNDLDAPGEPDFNM